jgi:hypothetical protein
VTVNGNGGGAPLIWITAIVAALLSQLAASTVARTGPNHHTLPAHRSAHRISSGGHVSFGTAL